MGRHARADRFVRGALSCGIAALLLAGCSGDAAEERGPVSASNFEVTETVSGYTFLTAETQALQDDDFANPGMLWATQGETLFAGEAGCATCHESGDLVGAAATYPRVDETSGALLNLEGRINQCRTQRQDRPALPYESDALLSLTTYVASLSRGMPIDVTYDGAAAYYATGLDYFTTRRGQFNLACSTCHDQNAGKQLRGDTISQGHGNGFPAYRLEWQSVGSLHRRLRDCDTGVRAEPLAFGDETYVALELYLAARAQGLNIETPAVRR